MRADHTAKRSPRWPRSRLLGAAAMALGIVLIGAAAAYFGYTFAAGRGLDDLIAAGADPAGTLDAPRAAGGAPSAQALYPGSLLAVRLWAAPRGTLDLAAPELQGFTSVNGSGRPSIAGTVGRAANITIPALGIDVAIEELGIADLGDSSAYETPKFVVGHIPETPNPGSHGNGWYFGHLESPLGGEGNVFSRLPQVPGLLRDGEDVHVVLSSEGREYLYQVRETDIVHEDDIALYQASDARITLVTCFPRLKYDQRLLVTAKLIGIRDAAG